MTAEHWLVAAALINLGYCLRVLTEPTRRCK
jgi:hypothetical protein